MPKVTCNVCKYENNSYCEKKKNIKIKLNKRRLCKYYILEESKLVEKEIIKSTYIPYGKRKTIQKEINTKIDIDHIANNKYPLTGDLSKRFRTTAGDK